MLKINKIGKGFRKMQTEFALKKSSLPVKLANTIQIHFLRGFRRGGGSTDSSVGGWKPRKHSRSARKRKRSVGRALLVKSGKLRSDIRKRKMTFNDVRVGTRSIPYAEYINEGTTGMEQREFIGKSRILDKKIENQIQKELNKLFK